MRIIIKCLFIAFLTVLYSDLLAQAVNSSIEGKVLTESQLAADGSTVVLLSGRDSSIISSAIIGKGGRYQFKQVAPGGYLLMITYVGYSKSYNGPYKVTEGQMLSLPDITLHLAANQLKEISVVSKRPDVEVKPGKITLNIQNSLIAEGNSALELLKQSPGVRVDNNNNINLVGRQSALITIDGKTTNLTGEDLANYLRSLQANIIDRIELITSGSAKNDAAGGGIVNIVLKKGKNIGANGSVTATGGYGRYYKSNIGVVFNDRMTRFNVYGNYNYSNDKTYHTFTTDRLINYDDIESNYHVDYNDIRKSYNNTFGLGADYFLSANHTIGFLVNGFARQDNFTKDNGLNISNNGVMDSTITADSRLARHNTRVNYNLNYSGKLDKKGTTLSGDLNYSTSNRTSSEYITNDFFDASGSQYRDPLLLQNLSPSKIHVWLSKIDLSLLISKRSKIDLGVKYKRATSNNDLVFGPYVDGAYQSDPTFSNHFYYTENVNAAYINYEGKFDKVNLTLGLRGEQTKAQGNSVTNTSPIDSSYFGLFPQAQLTYSKNEKNEFSLSYSRGITRPAYEDVNPFLYYVDLYDYRSGNPNLKPEYTNTIELAHTYNKSFTTTLYTSIISDAYEFNFYEQNDASKVNITTQRNLGNVYNYGVRFYEPVKFTNWWSADFFLDASYQRYKAFPENGNLNKGTQDIIFSSSQNFVITSTLTAELIGKYESPTFYGVNQLKSTYYVSGVISQQLFNKRASIKLNVADIFNTLRDRARNTYENLNFTIVDKRETQVARLSFTYRFGKTSVKAITSRHTGTEDEQKRMGAGGSNR